MGEAERGESAPRLRISFWCSNGHETVPSFASDAQIPDTWDCPRCGFPAGKDRVYTTEKIGQVLIPRATTTTSGANFEILVGFEVTPEMAAFNRDGKRFRLNAGQATAAASK